MKKNLATIALSILFLASVAHCADRAPALAAALAKYQPAKFDRADSAQRTLIPYAMLQQKKLHVLRSKYTRSASAAKMADQLAARGLGALQQLRTGKPLLARPGRTFEGAYVTSNDSTVQPYYLYLPTGFTRTKKYPLFVFLHGYVPTISVLDPWVLDESTCANANKNDFILLTPYGRRNTDFQGVGELDVHETIREVQALYPVDPEQVHLTGVSMGGAGCYYIGLRAPGRFASFSTMGGQTDMHTWWPLILPAWPKSRDAIPPFRRWLVEWDNPIDLVMNARNQNFLVMHGERDHLVSVEQSRSFVKAAGALDIDITYQEQKGAGHYIYWDPKVFETAWAWQSRQRKQQVPPRVTFKTFSLEYDRAFWCRIDDFIEWGTPAEIDCSFDKNRRVLTATTKNVRVLAIDAAGAHAKTPFKAVVNGQKRTIHKNKAGEYEIICDDTPAREQAWPPRKHHGMCGPVEEVFDTPFLVVAGTAGTPQQTREIAQRVEKWADAWDRCADGRPIVVQDGQVTKKLILEHSLVLFGTPKTNSILQQLHAKLPIRIGDQSYEVAGKTYAGEDLGLVLCYPNPLNPKRYVTVYSGELYGEKCGVNHKHDLIPDFIVFNTRSFNYDDTNQHEVAGFFDRNWELSPKLTWIRKPQ
ncbi:MAG: prolyl oligopeptidase family serine peptidase [Lentisphaeria bacterium]|nr:prolyl oligopeptidase family serine peptidase [Lentisphaeria bacterium]